MAIHVEPIAETLRWYPTDGGYDAWEPAAAVATLQWCGPDEVLVSGLRGRMTMAFRAEMREMLMARGVKRMVYLRRGRRVVRDVI